MLLCWVVHLMETGQDLTLTCKMYVSRAKEAKDIKNYPWKVVQNFSGQHSSLTARRLGV